MLGATEVNDEVKRTIEEQPENFWYYNNGITIVAESIKNRWLVEIVEILVRLKRVI